MFTLQTLLGGLVLSATAQEAPVPRETSADNEMLLAGEDIRVVTATRTLERLRDSPSAVTVITEDQIRASAAKTLPDLLRSAPGVDVMSPNQSQANVSIRGFNDQFSNKLLVMVDGRSIYQDFYGTVFWTEEPLLLSRIKRIEIVRGPGSALYGANAFNGVINIITKTPQEMALAASKVTVIAARGGQDSTFAEGTVSGGQASGWAYSVGAGYHGTHGFSGNTPTAGFDRSGVPILMADAQRNLGKGSLRFSANLADAKADFDSIFVVPDGHWQNADYTLTYEEDKARYPLLIRAFANTLQLTNPSQQNITSRTYDLEAQQQRTLSAKNRIVYGIDFRDTEVRAFFTGGLRETRRSWSGYGQDETHLSARTSLFTGLRLDNNSQYGTNLSPRASLVHHLAPTQTVRLSYGTAFRAPTLVNDYFNTSIPVIPGVLNVQLAGNPDVKPERIQSLEAGYRQDFRSGYVSLDAFANRLTDLIQIQATQYAPSPPFPPNTGVYYTSLNIGSAQALGLEFDSQFALGRSLRGQVNYTYQNVTNEQHQQLSFSPRQKANLTLETSGDSRLSFRTDIHLVDQSLFRDIYHNGVSYTIGGYVRGDLKVGYHIGPAKQPWILSLAATNLLGDGHREFPDVASPISATPQSIPQGRTVWAGIENAW